MSISRLLAVAVSLATLASCKQTSVADGSPSAASAKGEGAVATTTAPAARGLRGSWTWTDAMKQTNVLLVTDKELVETLTGEGLPPDGVVVKSPIARVVPSLEAKEGVLVLGPLQERMKPYEAAHWFELEDGALKWHRSGDQYDTVDEGAASKGKRETVHPYKRVK